MKAHKYWSLGALAAIVGTFYTSCKEHENGSQIFCLQLSLLSVAIVTPLLWCK